VSCSLWETLQFVEMWMLREVETRGGEISFRDFMELALYDPDHGYYAAHSAPWGRDGDFLTAPSASDWYGWTLARLFAEIVELVGTRVRLIDLAAGDGSFLASVLDGLGAAGPAIFSGVTAVERSAAMRDQIRDRLAAADVHIRVAAELTADDDGPVVVHASELYDAMPVHRVRQGTDGLEELVVAAVGDHLAWRNRPAGTDLLGYFARHGVTLEEGQLAEVNLAAEPFHRDILRMAGEGLVLVLDYGYEAARLYDPRGRRHGSLVSYRRHRVDRDLLDQPGKRDLTAHVNWDDLRHAAALCGWVEVAQVPLAELLVRAGIAQVAELRGLGMTAELDAATVTARQEIKRLLDPEGMGSDLRMLIQGRGALAEAAREILSREP